SPRASDNHGRAGETRDAVPDRGPPTQHRLPDCGQEVQSASVTASTGRNTSTQVTDPRIRHARMRMKSCTTAPAATARVSFLFQSSRNAKCSIGTRQSVEL